MPYYWQLIPEQTLSIIHTVIKRNEGIQRKLLLLLILNSPFAR